MAQAKLTRTENGSSSRLLLVSDSSPDIPVGHLPSGNRKCSSHSSLALPTKLILSYLLLSLAWNANLVTPHSAPLMRSRCGVTFMGVGVGFTTVMRPQTSTNGPCTECCDPVIRRGLGVPPKLKNSGGLRSLRNCSTLASDLPRSSWACSSLRHVYWR